MTARLRFAATLAALAVAAVGSSAVHADAASGPVYTPAPAKPPVVYVVAPAKEASAPPAVSGTKPSRPRIATRPPRRTHQHRARFVFVGGNRFECELDRAAFRRCGSVFTRFVATGAHVLRVRPAGGGPVASFRWRVLSGH